MTTKETESETTFMKQQILVAKKYNDRRDLLNVLLSEDKQYTLDQVDTVINEFLEKEFDKTNDKEVK